MNWKEIVFSNYVYGLMKKDSNPMVHFRELQQTINAGVCHTTCSGPHCWRQNWGNIRRHHIVHTGGIAIHCAYDASCLFTDGIVDRGEKLTENINLEQKLTNTFLSRVDSRQAVHLCDFHPQIAVPTIPSWLFCFSGAVQRSYKLPINASCSSFMRLYRRRTSSGMALTDAEEFASADFYHKQHLLDTLI